MRAAWSLASLTEETFALVSEGAACRASRTLPLGPFLMIELCAIPVVVSHFVPPRDLREETSNSRTCGGRLTRFLETDCHDAIDRRTRLSRLRGGIVFRDD